MSASRHIARDLWRFATQRDGAAAVELALLLPVFALVFVNVADLGFYEYRRVQVEMAAEAGAQAVHRLCTPLQVPATINCPGLTTANINTAVQSTSLGTSVTLQAASPSEGYYCVDGTGKLQLVAAVTTTTGVNCSAYGSSEAPGDYVQVAVTYTYTPLFTSTIAAVAGLGGAVQRTAWYRVQ